MKKIMKALAAGALTASVLSAAPLFVNDPYEDDFAKMQQYFNAMIESHIKAPLLSNINYPRTNIQDKGDKIVLEFDVAGVDKKNIKLTIDEHNLLTLTGKKESKVEEKKDDGSYVRREIFYGSFQRVIQLPQNIDQSGLKTEYSNGILKVVIPKKEIKKPKAKVIPIN